MGEFDAITFEERLSLYDGGDGSPDFNFEDVLYASGKGASGWRVSWALPFGYYLDEFFLSFGPASCKSIKTSNFSDGNLSPHDNDKQCDNKEGFYGAAIEFIFVLEVISDEALTTSTTCCIILNEGENEADDLGIDHP
ncbi:hypothetical protein V6N13_055643 [Hibiscus sabdariffa]